MHQNKDFLVSVLKKNKFNNSSPVFLCKIQLFYPESQSNAFTRRFAHTRKFELVEFKKRTRKTLI